MEESCENKSRNVAINMDESYKYTVERKRYKWIHTVWHYATILWKSAIHQYTLLRITSSGSQSVRKCAGAITITKFTVEMRNWDEFVERYIVSLSSPGIVLFLKLMMGAWMFIINTLYAFSYVSTLPNKFEPNMLRYNDSELSKLMTFKNACITDKLHVNQIYKPFLKCNMQYAFLKGICGDFLIQHSLLGTLGVKITYWMKTCSINTKWILNMWKALWYVLGIQMWIRQGPIPKAILSNERGRPVN